ncbi:MAG: hypothetical protein HUU25_03455 [Candidatus Sumerlaeia bacterium]|nr:hypothetical protein [Candidatus Sumerlaeia bacterium]
MRLALLLAAALSLPSLAAQPASGELFGVPRPTDHDLLELTAGDRLVGTLREQRISVQTAYALIALPLDRVAGIDRSSEGGDPRPPLEQLVSASGDVFHGLGVEPVLHFEIAGGRVLEVPREHLSRLLLRPRSPPPLPRRQHFVLRGGDHFSGLLHHEGPLEVRAPYGAVSLNLAEVRAIALPRGGQHGRVTMLTGTDTAGDPQLDRILVDLDILDGLGAPPADLAPQRVDLILAQAGATPDEEMLAQFARRRSRSLIEGSIEIETDGTPMSGQITTETDTYHFRARRGVTYTLETRNIVNLDTFIRLLGTDAQQRLGENDDGGGSLASRLTWTCPENGVYYLQVWRLGMGPDQVQPGVYYGYPPGNYDVVVTEQSR